MGRRLSDEERAQRIVGSPYIRTLSATGRCQICKERIAKGGRSLRYTTISFNRKQEVGVCLPCASQLWHFAEIAVGKISVELEEFKDAQKESGSTVNVANSK